MCSRRTRLAKVSRLAGGETTASRRRPGFLSAETLGLLGRSACARPLGWPGRSARKRPRYRVELTASKELRDKLTHAQDLMRHRNPSGDLAVILDRALDLLIAKRESERFGKTKRPRNVGPAPAVSDETATRPRDPASAPAMTSDEAPTRPHDLAGAPSDQRPTPERHVDGWPTHANKRPTRRGYIRRSVRRAVYERDGGQCTYVDAGGRRCPSRGFLELDHIVSKALGGSDEVENVRLRCRMHDRLHAEQVFGRAHVERQIHLRQQKRTREEAAAPSFEAAARGLRNLGFRDTDVRRALATVRARLAPSHRPKPSFAKRCAS